MAFPYDSLAGVMSRSALRPSYFLDVESATPGFTVQAIASHQSFLNARLRKRCGRSLPFGQGAPPLDASGLTPPAIALQGRPVVGSLLMMLQVLTGGALGTATFQWSANAGQSWAIAAAMVATGTTPPAVTLAGLSAAAVPSDIVLQCTLGGTRAAAQFVWSSSGAAGPWNLSPSAIAGGASPPLVTFSGLSNVAQPGNVQIQITTAGALNAAVFQWSQDGGATWTTGVFTGPAIPLGATGLTANFGPGTYATSNTYQAQGLATAASVALGATGLSALFPAGTYTAGGSPDTWTAQGLATAATVPLGTTGLVAILPGGAASYDPSNLYAASTPVPEVILKWLNYLVSYDVLERHGANPADPFVARRAADRDTAKKELEEAANSRDGLFDLPIQDDEGSAITTGGPAFYSETSPYVGQDQEGERGEREDARGRGTFLPGR